MDHEEDEFGGWFCYDCNEFLDDMDAPEEEPDWRD
jgi:hypothetical protein